MLSKSAAVVLFALPWRATSKAAEQGWKESSLNNCGMDSRPQKGTVPKYNSNGFHLRQYLFHIHSFCILLIDDLQEMFILVTKIWTEYYVYVLTRNL